MQLQSEGHAKTKWQKTLQANHTSGTEEYMYNQNI